MSEYNFQLQRLLYRNGFDHRAARILMWKGDLRGYSACHWPVCAGEWRKPGVLWLAEFSQCDSSKGMCGMCNGRGSYRVGSRACWQCRRLLVLDVLVIVALLTGATCRTALFDTQGNQ